MQRPRPGNILQIGICIFCIGIAIHIALAVGMLLQPFANIAIVIGLIVAIVGLVLPNRR